MEQNTSEFADIQFDLSAVKAKRKKKKAAALGVVVLLFALLGVVTFISFTVQTINNMIGHEQEKQKFEELIRPVVMFDPVPFDGIADAGNTTLLQASVWGTLLSGQKTTYAYDETGLLIIPASDIDLSAVRLFGPDVVLEHQTFGDVEMTFLYDKTTKTYRVPSIGYLGIYTPEVLDIQRQNGYTVLKVGYVSPGYIWSYDEQGREVNPEPAKIYYYVLLQNKNGYYITAIRENNPLDVGAESGTPV